MGLGHLVPEVGREGTMSEQFMAGCAWLGIALLLGVADLLWRSRVRRRR